MKNKFIESAKDEGIELFILITVYPFMFFVVAVTFLIDAILVVLGLMMKITKFIFTRGSHE